MKLIIAALILASVGIATAYAGNMLLFVGSSGSAPVVLTNQRITDTGAFRITDTTNNRAVFP